MKPVVDQDLCIGCGACEEICPTKAIRSGTMEELNELGRQQASRRLIGAEAFPSLVIE